MREFQNDLKLLEQRLTVKMMEIEQRLTLRTGAMLAAAIGIREADQMTQPRLTPDERRERNRLRSLRWRRAHGIGPRKPAQRPWLALGISRSTYYRRRAKAREQAALAAAMAAKEAVLDRLQWQLAELRASLDKMAVANAAMAAELTASPLHVGDFE